jgi:hypothetical protein
MVLTPKRDEYLSKARECRARAEQTPDHFIKEQLREIAQKWEEMALYEEKMRRGNDAD